MTGVYFISGIILTGIGIWYIKDKDPLVYRMSGKEELLFGIFYFIGIALVSIAFLEIGG